MQKLYDTSDLRLPSVATSPAEQAFETLAKQIADFEKTLNDEEAVGSLLASFGQCVNLNIRNVSRAGQFICMSGTLADGSEANLVQHFTQISVLLVKVKVQPEVQRAPIGFVTT
jgi:hypothetical protein